MMKSRRSTGNPPPSRPYQSLQRKTCTLLWPRTGHGPAPGRRASHGLCNRRCRAATGESDAAAFRRDLF
jgi:hypothetical protein